MGNREDISILVTAVLVTVRKKRSNGNGSIVLNQALSIIQLQHSALQV